MTERERALTILNRVDRDLAFAAPLLDAVGTSVHAHFIRTVVMGVLRWRLTLDFLIETISKRKVSKIDPPVLQILRIGFYQLFDMRVPEYAVVDESVDLASRHAHRAKGFVNAVLRQAAAQALRSLLPQDDSVSSLAVRFSHPEWLMTRWIEQFGRERAGRIAEANQQLSFPDLLVNTRRISRDEMVAVLTAKGIRCSASSLLTNVIRLQQSTSEVTEEIEKGLVYAMDEGSVAVATLAGLDSRRVLDLAAAPGGKSLTMTLAGHHVVGHDLSWRRIQPLRRSPFARTFVVVGDGRRAPFSRHFEVVLLDAPCSATGTIRKHPEIKWRLRPEAIKKHTETQGELLRSALRMASDTCIYATCSLEREENEGVIESVLKDAEGFESFDLSTVAPPTLTSWIEGGILRLTPEAGTDGFVAVGLRRKR